MLYHSIVIITDSSTCIWYEKLLLYKYYSNRLYDETSVCIYTCVGHVVIMYTCSRATEDHLDLWVPQAWREIKYVFHRVLVEINKLTYLFQLHCTWQESLISNPGILLIHVSMTVETSTDLPMDRSLTNFDTKLFVFFLNATTVKIWCI